jgi:hypothetical protein
MMSQSEPAGSSLAPKVNNQAHEEQTKVPRHIHQVNAEQEQDAIDHDLQFVRVIWEDREVQLQAFVCPSVLDQDDD